MTHEMEAEMASIGSVHHRGRAAWGAISLVAIAMSSCAINQERSLSQEATAQEAAQQTQSATTEVEPGVVPSVPVPPLSAAELFPAPGTTADVLGRLDTPRTAELAARIAAAAALDPPWWADFLATAAEPGQPLPYHPNLGLSEAEYAEYLAGVATAGVGVIGQMTIGTSTGPAGEFEIAWTSVEHGSGRVVLDPATLDVRASTGEAIAPTPWSQDEPGSLVGSEIGWRWLLERPAPETDWRAFTGSTVDMSLTVRQSDGRVVLYVATSTMQAGGIVERADIHALYDRPLAS